MGGIIHQININTKRKPQSKKRKDSYYRKDKERLNLLHKFTS